MNKNTLISWTLSAIILFNSCSSTTLIQSTPTGAKLYIDGQPVGNTPYSYSDTKIVGSNTAIKIEMNGYEPLSTSITRDEKVDVGAIIGGILVLVPFLWVMKYNPTHSYELVPLSINIKNDTKVEPNNTITNKNNSSTKAERLREYKKLLDEGVITQDEFDKEKKKILEEKEQ